MSEHSKIQLRGEGIGEIDESLLLKRATEIAHTDGRPTANENDINHAREEIVNGYQASSAPETTPETEQLVEWDDISTEHGTQAVKVPMEDEGNIVEELVLEGVEEADHDRRVESLPLDEEE